MMQPLTSDWDGRYAGTKLMGAIGRNNLTTGAKLGAMAAGAAGDIKSQREVSKAQSELSKAYAYANQPVSSGNNWSGLLGAATSIAGGLFSGGGGGGSSPFSDFGSAANLDFKMPSYMSGAGNFGSFFSG